MYVTLIKFHEKLKTKKVNKGRKLFSRRYIINNSMNKNHILIAGQKIYEYENKLDWVLNQK